MTAPASADALLAVDLGTQSLRLTAFGADGQRHWSWSRPVDSTITDAVFEQSPAQWGALLEAGLAEAWAAGVAPVAIAAAGPLAGYVALDARGQALAPAVMYSDTRAAAWLAPLRAALQATGDDHGLRVHHADPLPQWLRWRHGEPGLVPQTAAFVDATGWLNHFLTGETSMNVYTGLRRYDEAVRAALGVADAPFGRIVPLGETIGTLRRRLQPSGAARSIPVISATFDSKCAYLGSGLTRPGEATDISGTVTSIGVLATAAVDDARRRIYTVPLGQHHLIRGSTSAAGSSLEWFRRTVLDTSAEGLEALARQAPAGANGVGFLPYLSGERTPFWNERARGSLYGLNLASDRHDLARGVLEGLACSAAHIVAVMRECGVVPSTLRAAGGLARSDLLCQIKADMIGVPIARLADHELTSLGLAAIMAVAVGQAPDLATASRQRVAIERWFEPDHQTVAAHRQALQRYLAASAAMAATFTTADPSPG